METTRESKIERINEVMSDKTLSFGCIIRPYLSSRNAQVIGISAYQKGDDKYDTYLRDGRDSTFKISIYNLHRSKVIGHPVMIGDVLNWIESHETPIEYMSWGEYGDFMKSLNWLHKRKSLEQQSDGCIDYIYSLLPTKDDFKRK